MVRISSSRRPRPTPSWVVLTSLCSLGACSGDTGDRPAFRPGRAVHDISKIELSGFAQDPAVQQRVLRMPFGEAAARLGSLRFDAVTSFEFTRGGEIYEQQDVYQVQQDPNGNFHIRLDTPVSQVEYFLVGEDVYVRLDKGPLRKKPRREVETEATCQIAFASIYQTLDLFRPRLELHSPTPAEVDGRSAVRYALRLAKNAPQAPGEVSIDTLAPRAVALPIAPPPRWRELARPLDVNGNLWIDNRTGVVLKTRVQGRIEIPDRDVRPTQLTLSFSAAISKVGEVTSIEVPKSVEEFRRVPPPRDLLGFFREHLPQPAQEIPSGATQPTP